MGETDKECTYRCTPSAMFLVFRSRVRPECKIYFFAKCWIHTVSGGVFFFTLAIYSLYHFPRGHFGLRLETRNEQRDAIYFASGVTILGCMFVMGIQLFLLPESVKSFLNRLNSIFWLEWIAVWAFAAAWLVKGDALLADSRSGDTASH